MIEDVYVTNSQNKILKGKFSPVSTENEKCVIYVHGLGGTFDTLAQSVLSFCNATGMPFIWAGTQSRHVDDKIKQNNDGEIVLVNSGAKYENFSNSLPDLYAWIEFAREKKYKNITLIGHCYGCNKIIFLLNKISIPECHNCIFLAPNDFSNIYTSPRHSGLYEEALQNIKNGKKEAILSKLVYGFCDMTSSAFIRLGKNPNINSLPFQQKNGNFTMLEKLSQNILFVIGENDRGLGENCPRETTEKYMQKLCNHCKNGNYKIIPQGRHSFKGTEDLVNLALSPFLEITNNIEREEE